MVRRGGVLCVAAAIALVVGACVKQGVSEGGLVRPTAKMAKESGVALESLGGGYVLYRSKCAQCHALKSPEDVNLKDWHSIVPGMAWNAGMNKKEEKKVMAYLKAATAQTN